MAQPLDLDAYVAHINYSGPRTPICDTLAGIRRDHTAKVPFESFDVLLGRPIRLDPEALRPTFRCEQREWTVTVASAPRTSIAGWSSMAGRSLIGNIHWTVWPVRILAVIAVLTSGQENSTWLGIGPGRINTNHGRHEV